MNSQSYVPYQAYKSKRHSRNLSSTQLAPNVSPPPTSRPPMSTINGHHHQTSVGSQNQDFVGDLEKSVPLNGANRVYDVSPPSSISRSVPHNFEHLTPLSTDFTTSPAESPSPTEEAPSSASAAGSDKQSTPTSPVVTHPPSPPQVTFPVSVVTYNGSAAVPSTSSSPGPSPKPASGTRRLSTFRHVPLRGPNPRTSFPSSPLRPSGTHARTMSTLSASSRQLDLSKGRTTEASSRTSSTLSTPLLVPERASLPNIPSLDLPSQAPSSGSATVSPSPGPNPAIPTPRISSPPPPAPPPKPAPTRAPTQPQGPPPVNSPAVTSPLPARPSQHVPRSPAPYRPDFQPRGVYRQRTDDFIEARRRTRDSGRIERTRLERRLEKLINLHFPNPHHENRRSSLQVSNGHVDDRSSKQIRRSSSIFDFNFSDLKHKSAADLWKDVIQSQASSGSKVDTRAAEQTITPWQEDSTVSHCPLCSTSFHPLTNRKHHCRLCGRIMCSLPVKYPQRPQTCSLLFVADPLTGQIEEVGEVVDYGVRRKNTGHSQGKGKGKEGALSDEDKFLKGVRICRDCRPVLLRRQYIQEIHRIPTFTRLYDAFVLLEKEIEDSLPQFQELIISLSNGHEDRPTTEVTMARKRLVEAFAQYDALAKRIRMLPCPQGQNSSQDRIQTAILTRANLFLQKNMFPLQALPKPKRISATASQDSSESANKQSSHVIDPDSEIAHALQPLLEQEALLESFVEEAKAHRKFEDAKTLKANLREIRVEIDRMLVNAGSGFGKSVHGGVGSGRGEGGK